MNKMEKEEKSRDRKRFKFCIAISVATAVTRTIIGIAIPQAIPIPKVSKAAKQLLSSILHETTRKRDASLYGADAEDMNSAQESAADIAAAEEDDSTAAGVALRDLERMHRDQQYGHLLPSLDGYNTATGEQGSV